MNSSKELHIVAAVLINRSGRVLIARKRSGLSNEGLFEFPGGKAEAGESFNEALYRELYEELGIKVSVPCNTILDYIYRTNDGRDLHFHIFEIKLDADMELSSTDHDQLLWVEAGSTDTYPLAKADLPVAFYLKSLK